MTCTLSIWTDSAIDPLRSYFCFVHHPSRSERVQRAVVDIRVSILDLIFVNYSDQVNYIYMTCCSFINEEPSLRVNLDMGKTVYAQQIMNDHEIPDTIVRTSTLPEELGRIEYLLSDKTGTLTQNGNKTSVRYRLAAYLRLLLAEMDMKKLHMGTMSYGFDSMDEVAHQLAMAYGNPPEPGNLTIFLSHTPLIWI